MSVILVIGGGGREHAIVTKLISSPLVQSILVSPGNAGTGSIPNVRNLPLNLEEHQEVVKCCKENSVSLVVIGPEGPLANGLTDSLTKEGIKVFGPTKDAAQLESSKAWAKGFMKRHSIPTAAFKILPFDEVEKFLERCNESIFAYTGFAIKASGLAGGKGVFIADKKTTGKEILQSFRDFKSSVIISSFATTVVEEKLTGYEISVLAFSDGTTVKVMPPVQDHKRRFEGEWGVNTGGMGAYCPYPLVSEKDLEFIRTNILQKAVDEMKREGNPYVGVLYAGIMMTDSGPKVLEFNCRFGDPETQVLMLLLKSDLYSAMLACVDGKLKDTPVEFDEDLFASTVTVVIESYPGDVNLGLNKIIKGIEGLEASYVGTQKLKIFMAGAKTGEHSKEYLTSGGRVLNVCSVAKCLEESMGIALTAASKVYFENALEGHNADFRKDIGFNAIKSYEEAGVNIEEGKRFVRNIEKFCKQTNRAGVKGSLGMFGAVFDPKLEGYNNPLLVSGTDGVGTKLKVAIASNSHGTIGQDLVAMSVNDILMHAAEPLFFLDYLACGKLESIPKDVILEGISKGCLLAQCALVGGETAEMSGMYQNSDYDVAGFAVGAVEEKEILPQMNKMEAGNLLIGVASSGLHSNGFSLVRKVLDTMDISLSDPAPFNEKESFVRELLKPTHIYVTLLELLRSGLILGAAHITGGGIAENLERIIPENLSAKIDREWDIPSVFLWLSSLGIRTEEMLKTFNLGLGLIFVIKAESERAVLDYIQRDFTESLTPDTMATYLQSELKVPSGSGAWVIGSLAEIKDGENRTEITSVEESLQRGSALLLRSFPDLMQYGSKKRVAVLISGTGTNMQALLNHTLSGLSKAEIVLVISNVAGVRGLEIASKSNVPTLVIPHKDFSSRQLFEEEINKALNQYHVELVCLAGFMRILTGTFVRSWEGGC